jgi:hypothetical protein
MMSTDLQRGGGARARAALLQHARQQLRSALESGRGSGQRRAGGGGDGGPTAPAPAAARCRGRRAKVGPGRRPSPRPRAGCAGLPRARKLSPSPSPLVRDSKQLGSNVSFDPKRLMMNTRVRGQAQLAVHSEPATERPRGLTGGRGPGLLQQRALVAGRGARRDLRIQPHRRLRQRGTRSLRKSGIKWTTVTAVKGDNAADPYVTWTAAWVTWVSLLARCTLAIGGKVI